MKTRLYTPEDYALAAQWWGMHGTDGIPSNVLPALGVVAIEDDGTPLAMAWLYQDNTVGVAWVGWMTTKHGLLPLKAERALRILMGGVDAAARAQGRGLLFTMTKRFALGRWLEGQGWIANDRHSTQYFKPLPPAVPPNGS